MEGYKKNRNRNSLQEEQAQEMRRAVPLCVEEQMEYVELCLRMEEELRGNLWVRVKGGQRQVTLECHSQEDQGGWKQPGLMGADPAHGRRWNWIIFKVLPITNHSVTLETCCNY